MLHTWVGLRNRLPAADDPGLHTRSLSSVAGFRSGFMGQLWLPLFFGAAQHGGNYFKYIKIKICRYGAIEAAG